MISMCVAVFIACVGRFAATPRIRRAFPMERICESRRRPILDFHLPILLWLLLLVLKLVWALYFSVELVNLSCLLHLNRFVVSLFALRLSVLCMRVCLYIVPDKTIFLIRCPSRYRVDLMLVYMRVYPTFCYSTMTSLISFLLPLVLLFFESLRKVRVVSSPFVLFGCYL